MTDSNGEEVSEDSIETSEVNKSLVEGQGQAHDSAQENSVPETVPYDRFSEVNSEKNALKEYKAKYEEQVAINNKLSSNVSNYIESQNTSPDTLDEPETMQDLLSLVEKKVEDRMRPIEQDRQVAAIKGNINNYFSSDKEASSIKVQMDSYYDNLPSYRQQAVLDAVSKGDISVLNEIKNTVAIQHNINLKGMASQAAQGDANRAMSPNASKVIKSTAPILSDLVSEGKKSGNFDSFFSSFAKQSGFV